MRFAVAACLLLAIPAPAEPPAGRQDAIDRGVAGLRKRQRPNGSWGEYGPGSTALVALALLEAGVPPSDPAVVAAARYVRHEAVRSAHNYSVSLAALFLERLGEKDDAPVVKSLVERIVAGQLPSGGWTYALPLRSLSPVEARLPPPPGGAEDATHRVDRAHSTVSSADNSNTPFAVLALWAGRGSGVNVRRPLAAVAAGYRSSVQVSPLGAAWGYDANMPQPNGARCCAGLIALAVQFGAESERRLKNAPAEDPKAPARPRSALTDQIVREAWRYATAAFVAEVNNATRTDFYFLWSYERAAVAYGLNKIFGVDWHELGCRKLLATQGADGLWSGGHGTDVDTAFALLFLARADVTRSLSGYVRGEVNANHLTGGEIGEDGPPSVESLVKQWSDARGPDRDGLLTLYRDTRGPVYTEALIRMIAASDGDEKKAVRGALAERLARMTNDTLRGLLKDRDEEVRRAAAVACAIKGDRELTGDLIAALDDPAPWVVRAAGVALARLTGQEFGPPPNATAAEQARAVAAWKEWWRKQLR
jgi:hypothetical protein